MKAKRKLSILLGILLFFVALGLYLFSCPIHISTKLTTPYDITIQHGSASINAYLSDDVEIYIPDKILGMKVTSIENNVFQHLGTNVIFLHIPSSIQIASNLYNAESQSYYSIWFNDFYLDKYIGCEKKIKIPDAVWGRKVTGISPLCFEDADPEEVIIPDTVTYIGGGSFWYCKNLKKITLPPHLETIEVYAFEYSGIEKIDLPKTVLKIGTGAFAYSCLNEINGLEHVSNIEHWAFRGTPWEENIKGDFVCFGDTLHLYRGLETEVVLPSTIKIINGGFYIEENYPYPISVKKVFIPESVTTILSESFYGQKEIEVYIPKSVTALGCNDADLPLEYTGCIFENRMDGIIVTTEGSPAEAYAIAKGIPYKIITEEEMQQEMEKASNTSK